MSNVRIGVVGTGAIAQVAHLSVLPKLDGATLVAVCDIDLPKAQSLASRIGVKDVYDDIEDLIKYSRPDALAICTPNHLHEVHTLTALSAGVHVLCERPLALSAAGVRKVAAAQQRSGRAVVVGMNHRFRRDVQGLRGFLRSGELGQLHAMRAGWFTFRPSRQALGWRRRRDQSGGGVLLDLGLPLVDLALWLADGPTPKSVSAAVSPEPTASAVEDAGCALIRCERGLSIFADVSWHHVGDKERFWFELMGGGGSAALSPLRVFKEMHGAAMNVASSGASGSENPFNASYRAEWAHFLAVARANIEMPTLDDQVLLHQIFEAIQQSAREGREVAL